MIAEVHEASPDATVPMFARLPTVSEFRVLELPVIDMTSMATAVRELVLI